MTGDALKIPQTCFRHCFFWQGSEHSRLNLEYNIQLEVILRLKPTEYQDEKT
jgi:hypothetical protein